MDLDGKRMASDGVGSRAWRFLARVASGANLTNGERC